MANEEDFLQLLGPGGGEPQEPVPESSELTQLLNMSTKEQLTGKQKAGGILAALGDAASTFAAIKARRPAPPSAAARISRQRLIKQDRKTKERFAEIARLTRIQQREDDKEFATAERVAGEAATVAAAEKNRAFVTERDRLNREGRLADIPKMRAFEISESEFLAERPDLIEILQNPEGDVDLEALAEAKAIVAAGQLKRFDAEHGKEGRVARTNAIGDVDTIISDAILAVTADPDAKEGEIRKGIALINSRTFLTEEDKTDARERLASILEQLSPTVEPEPRQPPPLQSITDEARNAMARAAGGAIGGLSDLLPIPGAMGAAGSELAGAIAGAPQALGDAAVRLQGGVGGTITDLLESFANREKKTAETPGLLRFGGARPE